MCLELFDKYDEVEQIYEKILEVELVNGVVCKRLIVIFKVQNKVGEVVKELNEYLKKFMSD